MPVVMDAERISRALTRISHEILEHNRGLSDLALVGVRSRGVPIAHRIADDLKKITGDEIAVGALDITLYRDDLMGASVGIAPMVRKTEIPFSIDGRTPAIAARCTTASGRTPPISAAMRARSRMSASTNRNPLRPESAARFSRLIAGS